jgi:type I restriction enzyme, S subunit
MLLEAKIPAPLIDEQRRIVNLIDSVESVAYRADEEASAALQTVASHEALVCQAAKSAKYTTLGAIAEVVGGITKDKKKEGGVGLIEVPYLRVANVQRGFLDLSTMANIRVQPSIARRLRLLPGDILLTESGDRDKLGRGWIWEDQIADCVHQNHVFRARLYDEGFEPKFVSLWANVFGQQWFYDNGGQTTGIASISLSTLKRFPVPKLPLQNQFEATSTSDAARSTADRAKSLAMAARDLRAALLSELLSGQHQIPASYDALLRTA